MIIYIPKNTLSKYLYFIFRRITLHKSIIRWLDAYSLYMQLNRLVFIIHSATVLVGTLYSLSFVLDNVYTSCLTFYIL